MLIYGVFARGYASVDSPVLLLGAVTVPHEGPVTSFSSLPPLESHHTNIPHHRVNQVSFAAFSGQMIFEPLFDQGFDSDSIDRITDSRDQKSIDDFVSNCVSNYFLIGNFFEWILFFFSWKFVHDRKTESVILLPQYYYNRE